MKIICVLTLIILAAESSSGQKCWFEGCECVGSGSHLEILCLSANDGSFPRRVTNSPPIISSLEIRNYKIDQLPDFIFSNLVIGELRLINNSLKTIGKNSFGGVKRLDILRVIEFGLDRIESSAFKPLKNTLKVFQLTANLTDSVLNALVNNATDANSLSELNLSGNQLTGVDLGLSWAFRRLNTLNLAANQIRGFDSRSFTGFQRLTSLYLDLNKINDLDKLMLALGPVRNSLVDLRLSQNEIEFLIDFPRFPRLRQLSLDGNRIERLGATHLKTLSQLRLLGLGRNLLAIIEPGSFSTLILLQTLGLGNNRLTFVPDIFNLVNLNYLFLNNQIGDFRWVDNYAFQRIIPPVSPMTIYLDGNENLNFANKTFCGNYPNFQLNEFVISASAAQNFNKCLFKQIPGKSPKTLSIEDSINGSPSNTSAICTCEFIQFASLHGFRVTGACEGFEKNCLGHISKDDCGKEYECGNSNLTTTKNTQTIISSNNAADDIIDKTK